MKNLYSKIIRGFTLLEMLLVMVIMGSILLLLTNYSSTKLSQFMLDKAALQMQQILNAGLVYYINNGTWPSQSNGVCISSGVAPLQPNYLPANAGNSPYGSAYTINCNMAYGTFTVSTTIPGTATGATNATILAGMIPLGSASGTTVTGQVSIPGQNLNNARSVNFAGYYHNGGCVPAPTCPGGMAPDILVVPVSLYGVNDMSASSNYYPLYGFTAYAYGTAGTPPSSLPDNYQNVADCYTPSVARPCLQDVNGTIVQDGATVPDTYFYWRVCLSVTTVKGVVAQTADSGWGQYATVMAITRCVPQNENSGSDFTVWTR